MNRRRSQLLVAIASWIVLASPTAGREAKLTLDQRLIVACFKLDVDGVAAALHDGANVNARFGKYDRDILRDPWTGGYSDIGSDEWTPLLATANAQRYPDPPREVKDTPEDREWAQNELHKMSPDVVKSRHRSEVTIAAILIAKGADLDKDDGHGATALYDSIYEGNLELAELLIRAGAKVNTTTGTYVDGPSGLTPLHRALWSAELVRLLLAHGADPQAKTSEGVTPIDEVDDQTDPEVKKLLPPNRVAAEEPARGESTMVDEFLSEPADARKDAEGLYVYGVTRENQASVLARLASMPMLRRLRLRFVDDSTVPADAPVLSALRSIVFSGSHVSQATIEWLGHCPSLRSMTLFDVPDLSSLHVEPLKLSELEVSQCTLSKSTASRLLASCDDVHFHWCKITPDSTTAPVTTRP